MWAWLSGNASVSPGNEPVEGLTVVYRAAPKEVDGWRLFPTVDDDDPAPMWGAGAVVYIEQEEEQRRAIGGAHSGKKRLNYTVLINILFRSLIGDPTSGELDPGEASMDAYDGVIENIKERLRADRTLGRPDIFSAGEGGEGMAPDIILTSAAPILDAEELLIWGWLQVQVTQFITS